MRRKINRVTSNMIAILVNILYLKCGKYGYVLVLPLIRLFVCRTTRSYVIIGSGDEIVTVRSWLSRQDLQLPGGGVHKNETPIAAAIRETQEEVGIILKSSQLNLVARGTWHSDKLGFSYYIFQTELTSKQRIKARRFEIISADYTSRSKFRSNTSLEIITALKLIS